MRSDINALLETLRESSDQSKPDHQIRLAYYEAFARLTGNNRSISAWWGEAIIIVGGLAAYFLHPAWLALSILGLSWAVNSLDTYTRSSVVALVDCLETLGKQSEQAR